MKRGRIRLEDGRELPPDFKQFAHGYAVTAHRSQGKSVDSVIISGGRNAERAILRGGVARQKSVQVITSDKELLRESVARSTARQSASELARKARPGLHQGSYRGVACGPRTGSPRRQARTAKAPTSSRVAAECDAGSQDGTEPMSTAFDR